MLPWLVHMKLLELRMLLLLPVCLLMLVTCPPPPASQPEAQNMPY